MERKIVHHLVDRAFIERERALQVLDPVYWSVNVSDDPKAYEASLVRFTRGQRLALAVQWYQMEVDNGGHDQFFWNSTGIVWKDTLAGLEAFGLREFAGILREAVSRLGGDPPLEREPRQGLVEDLGGCFDDLDDRFFKLQRKRDLPTALTDWIRAHPDDFTFEGLVEQV